MDFSNFRISDGSSLEPWSLFFLRLGFFLSHYASQHKEGRLTVTITVPGAEFASAFLALVFFPAFSHSRSVDAVYLWAGKWYSPDYLGAQSVACMPCRCAMIALSFRGSQCVEFGMIAMRLRLPF